MSNEEMINSLNYISRKWNIPKEIYDLHLGKRNDLSIHEIKVNQVIFHIPKLSESRQYVLWNCLWPDCHNCCNKQGRLPLTKDDLFQISKSLGYDSPNHFITNETRISSWDEQGSSGNIISTLTMLSLKRKQNESDAEDGKPLTCRFLDTNGYCSIQSDKPGVCWLYPFASWIESNKGLPQVHATFQFTGDCPGYYLSPSLNDIMSILEEYSIKIYNYNMSIGRTLRDSFGITNIVNI
ncbi:MAG: YkgJ family cysteine cluster protein [Nitrososphaeraceae archaeon]